MKQEKTIKKWGEIKKKVFERDNYQCQFCGITKEERKLEIHHKDEENLKRHDKHPYQKNNNLDNLILLCVNCHKQLHGILKKGGLLDRRLIKLRNRLFREVWQENKNEVDMKDLSIIFKISLPQLYRILAEQKKVDKK